MYAGRVRATACVVAAASVVGGLLAAGGGYSAARTQLLSGAAWLVSSQVGQLTLLDGSSAEVAGQVQVAKPGAGLDVVQQGSNAYVVDRSAGSIRRIDGGTFAVSPPAVPIPEAGENLRAFASSTAVYALDTGRGVMTMTDPNTLANRSAPVPLAVRPSPQATALDADGRLWLLDSTTGDLVWMFRGQRHVRNGAATPGAGLLALAAGSPVVVDIQRKTADLLDRTTGATRHTTQLDLRPEDNVAVTGSARSLRIYVVASRGELSICSLTAANCGVAVPLASGGTDPGPAVEVNDRLFVPNYLTGQVWVIDLSQLRVVARPQVLAPATRFQLLQRDGVVFFNDPESERAGVIRLDGGFTAVPKYDPSDPDAGIIDPAVAIPDRAQQPPANKTPTTQPSRPPGGAPTSSAPPTVAQPPPTVAQPPPTQPTGPPVQPGGPAELPPLLISVGSPQVLVNDDVRLSVSTQRPPSPVSAHWTFGDGQGADGLSPTHRWTSAQTFQVNVQAIFPDGRTGVASVKLPVVARPVGTLVVTLTPGGSGTVVSQPGGISCPPACSADFPPGTAVTLTAARFTGFAFDHWTGGCTGTTSPCQLTVQTGQNAVGANFTTVAVPMVTVAVSIGGNGIGQVTGSGITCPGTCTTRVPQGTRVTLTARQTTQSSGFDTWSGSCANTLVTCNIIANADSSVTANFINLFQLTVDVRRTIGGPSGCCALDVAIGGPFSTPCTGHCVFFAKPNRSVTITVRTPSPIPTWHAVPSWGGDCAGQGIINGVDTCTLTMTGTKAVQKMFTEG
jgi:hypothetical protein